MIRSDEYDFNPWPSFTDLMVGMVAVLVLAMTTFFISRSLIDIKIAQEGQKTLYKAVKTRYSDANISHVNKDEPDSVDSKSNDYDLQIVDELDRQTYRFSDRILFNINQSVLLPRGIETLKSIGVSFKENEKIIREIQIQGHTDAQGTAIRNWYLGAERAISVQQFFQDECGLDPNTIKMSVNSFAQYTPISNDLSKNRRIEIVVYFTTQKKS